MLTVAESHNMTQRELEAVVFKGAEPSELRSLRETLGDDVVLNLGNHTAFEYFDQSFRNWVYNTWEEIMDEVC